MSDQGEQLKREDVEALAGELRDLKEVLREVSGKLGRIEKRLRLFYPESFPRPERRKEKSSDVQETPPTITSQQALELYSELVDMARTGREQQAEARVANLGIADLALLVKELGAPSGKKPNRTALTKSLMGRLKESIMLSRHTVRPGANRASQDERSGSSAQTEVSGKTADTPEGGERTGVKKLDQ
jgi:hypothetical protein